MEGEDDLEARLYSLEVGLYANQDVRYRGFNLEPGCIFSRATRNTESLDGGSNLVCSFE